MNRPCVRYQVDADDRIRFVDAEWIAFARQNAAAELDTDAVLDRSLWQFVVGKETRHLYQMIFTGVRERLSEKTVPFRCDSPTRRRYMELLVAPLVDGGLAISGSTVREEPRPYVALLDSGVPRTDELV
jgi:hypothetical protein